MTGSTRGNIDYVALPKITISLAAQYDSRIPGNLRPGRASIIGHALVQGVLPAE